MNDEQKVLETTPKLILCKETKVSMLKWKGREPSEANPNSSFSRVQGSFDYIAPFPAN